MNIDELLQKLDILNNNYKWIISESNKIAEEVERLDTEPVFNADKYELYCKKFLELEQRYANDRKEFKKNIFTSKELF